MHQKGMSAGRCPRHVIVRLFAAVSRLGCVRPNVLRFSGGAFKSEKAVEPNLRFKKAPISRARSAVRCKRLLGRLCGTLMIRKG